MAWPALCSRLPAELFQHEVSAVVQLLSHFRPGAPGEGQRPDATDADERGPQRRLKNFFLSPFRTVFAHARLLGATTLSEVRGLYAGSVLGTFWIAIGPLFLLTLYGIIYAVIFRFRPMDMTQLGYILYICAGLMPFIGFATALGAGVASVSANKQILLNTVFPAELIPLRMVLVHSTTLVVGLGVVVLIDAILETFSPLTLLLPVLMLLQVMLVTGVVWILGLLNLVVRDVLQSMTFVILALLVVTPIAYTPSMVPALLAPVVYANPLAYYVVCYQHIIVLDALPPAALLFGAFLFGPLSFCGGFFLFQRAKQSFFDYV